MAKEIPQMVRGLGMAMRLISSLNDLLKERGGHEEMLHFLTTVGGCENLGKIADLIVSLPWRVPQSVVMQLARKISIDDNGAAYAVTDEHCFWEPALKELGIPFVRFVDSDELTPEDQLLDELNGQLEGKTIVAGIPVQWKDTGYIVASICLASGEPMPGDIIEMKSVTHIHLVSVKHIDPDR